MKKLLLLKEDLEKYYKVELIPNCNLVSIVGENIKKIEINISQAKLVICTWNSTNFLNLLSSNIPTITFWNASFFPIEENAKPYLNELFNLCICFY